MSYSDHLGVDERRFRVIRVSAGFKVWDSGDGFLSVVLIDEAEAEVLATYLNGDHDVARVLADRAAWSAALRGDEVALVEEAHDYGDTVAYQRPCPTPGCKGGLLEYPARFDPVCGGTGYLVRWELVAEGEGAGHFEEPHGQTELSASCGETGEIL